MESTPDVDEERLHRVGPRHLQAAGEVPQGSSPRQVEQGEVRQAET